LYDNTTFDNCCICSSGKNKNKKPPGSTNVSVSKIENTGRQNHKREETLTRTREPEFDEM